VPGEGLKFERPLAVVDLDWPDNEVVLWFRIPVRAMAFLAGRPIANEADAKLIARRNAAKITNAMVAYCRKNGRRIVGGGARSLDEMYVRSLVGS